jgi:4-amino-4-deoxychorismate lyase
MAHVVAGGASKDDAAKDDTAKDEGDVARGESRDVPQVGRALPEGRPCVFAVLRAGEVSLGDPRTAFLRPDDLGVLRGDGVFERFLVRSGRPRHLEEHLQRMGRSASMVALDIPPAALWRQAVDLAASAWAGADEWEMRLVCTRGPEEGGPCTAYVLGQELSASVLRQRREGVAVITLERGLSSGLAGQMPWLLLGAKTLSYAANMAAKRWAEAHGADDAIFVGADGKIWEAETSAVVAAFGRRLVSPSPEVGILDSVSVKRLFDVARGAGWQAERDDLTLEDLLVADGVWLSSSLRFARVRTLDGKALAPAPAHAELAALAEAS